MTTGGFDFNQDVKVSLFPNRRRRKNGPKLLSESAPLVDNHGNSIWAVDLF